MYGFSKVRYLALQCAFQIGLASVMWSAQADVLDDSLRVRYTDNTQLNLGVGVDESEPSSAKQYCIEASPSDITLDTQGATRSRITTTGVFDIKEFENDFKFDYSFETTATAGITELFNASSTIKNTGKFELFLQNFGSSFSIIVEARAGHGSKRIRYSSGLKQEFQDMLDKGEHALFRERCGTHFVASHTLVSQITATIGVSGVSSNLRNTLQQSWSSSFGGGATIEGIELGAKLDSTTSLSNVLRLASKTGRINYFADARGGYGVPSLAAVMSQFTFKTEEMQNVYSAISNAAKDFTVDKADPDEFNLISYEIFGAKRTALKPDAFSKLDRLYRRIVRVDAVVNTYEGYKESQGILYNAYFRPIHDELLNLRAVLVNHYRECRNGGDCTVPDIKTGDVLDRVVFLDDLIVDAKFRVDCVNGHSLTNARGVSEKYISSADAVLDATIRFIDDLDTQSIRVFRFAPDNKLVPLPFDPTARFQTYNRTSGTSSDGSTSQASTRIQLDNIPISRSEITTETGVPSREKAATVRNGFRDLAYLVEIRFRTGLPIQEAFAIPDLTSCLITTP